MIHFFKIHEFIEILKKNPKNGKTCQERHLFSFTPHPFNARPYIIVNWNEIEWMQFSLIHSPAWRWKFHFSQVATKIKRPRKLLLFQLGWYDGHFMLTTKGPLQNFERYWKCVKIFVTHSKWIALFMEIYEWRNTSNTDRRRENEEKESKRHKRIKDRKWIYVKQNLRCEIAHCIVDLTREKHVIRTNVFYTWMSYSYLFDRNIISCIVICSKLLSQRTATRYI